MEAGHGITVTIEGTAYERLRFILDVVDSSSDERTYTEQDIVRLALIMAQIVMLSPHLIPLTAAARSRLVEEI